MRIKMRQKSSAFWKHGKHKGALVFSLQVNKQIAARQKPVEMYESMAELMKKGKRNAKKEKSGATRRDRETR